MCVSSRLSRRDVIRLRVYRELRIICLVSRRMGIGCRAKYVFISIDILPPNFYSYPWFYRFKYLILFLYIFRQFIIIIIHGVMRCVAQS